MRPTVSQQQFENSLKRAINTGPPDRTLRISKHTGEVTTARHGFFSRTVRRLIGPTGQDIEDNRRILETAERRLTEKFGRPIARAALLRARNQPANSALEDGKPLSVRQAQDARAVAERIRRSNIESREEGMRDHDLLIDDAVSGFYEAAEGQMEADVRTVAKYRLEDELRAHAHRHGSLPDVNAHVIQFGILEQLEKAPPRNMKDLAEGMKNARAQARGLVEAAVKGPSRDPNVFEAMGKLIESGERLAADYRHEDEDGSAYRTRPARRALAAAIARLDPGDARKVFEGAMDDESPLRRIGAAIAHGEASISAFNFGSAHRRGASRELRDHLRLLLEGFAARAAIPKAEADERIRWFEQQVADGSNLDERIDDPLSGDYERQVEERAKALYKTVVDEVLRDLDARFDTRPDVAGLSDDRKTVAHARVTDALRMSGPQNRDEIEDTIRVTVQQVASMPERQVAAELAITEGMEHSFGSSDDESRRSAGPRV